jgi:tripartite-type tricarboxylate transporter receptor subunit TctC
MGRAFRARGIGRRPLLAVLAAAPLAAPSVGQAQGAWPTRSIRMIVPFAAGGATDLITRLVTDRLGPALGQQVVVDNRGGAFGVVGADAAAKSPPDGYTLFSGSPGPLAVNQHVFKSLPYDPERDFVPVSMVASIPYVMVIPPSVPARSVQEFIALVRANPGRYNFGTSGMASRLTVEMFRAMAGGLDLTMLQYRGGAPARTDLLRGDLHLVIEQLPGFIEDFANRRLVPLAVGTRNRSSLLPEVPTMREAGLPDYEAWAWVGFAAPTGTPRPVIDRIATEIDRILQQPEVRERLKSWGSEPVGGTPKDMQRYLDTERARWGEAVRQAGIERE